MTIEGVDCELDECVPGGDRRDKPVERRSEKVTGVGRGRDNGVQHLACLLKRVGVEEDPAEVDDRHRYYPGDSGPETPGLPIPTALELPHLAVEDEKDAVVGTPEHEQPGGAMPEAEG